MTIGLSVLLPICNAQHSLEPAVTEILELLHDREATSHLWLVDDGSTDDTTDEAYELAACYPQISVIRHSARLGLAGSIAAALSQQRADLILITTAVYAFEPDDLRALWQLRGISPRPRRGRSKIEASASWLTRSPRLRTGNTSMQFFDRDTFETFRIGQDFERLRRVDNYATAPTPPPSRLNFSRANERAPREQKR